LPLHHLIAQNTPNNFYYWFLVGEGTLPLHHLITQNTPNKKTEMHN
jgi:hypothetical protein